MLNREDEVALAKQPGQGRREAEQCMRQAADIFGTMGTWQPSRSEPSAFGAAEHERQAVLAQHRALLQRLRQEDDPAITTGTTNEETLEDTRDEDRAELR